MSDEASDGGSMPLDGIRVIDWTIWQQGPVCSAILGDLGADVIKVEERVSGDPGRGMVRATGLDFSGRPNFYFEANNRNKRGIALDAKTREGREIILRLVDSADVFVQNFRQGVAERLGLGYEDLCARNPRIVYASANGYGRYGPDAGEPSFDYLGQARSGFMLATGCPEDPPCSIAGGPADQVGAILLAFGVVTALYARERSGVGQQVDASLLGSMTWLQGLNLTARLVLGTGMPRPAKLRMSNPLVNHYRCADGRWIALGMMQADRYWVALCEAVGVGSAARDPRFADTPSRLTHADEAVEMLATAFAKRPLAEWLSVLRAAGDFVFTPVQSIDDLPDDPQVLANGYITEVEHPTFGPMKMLGMPFQLSGTPGRVRRVAPEFGQHTEEILIDVLGYSWDDITRLQDDGVI